MTDEKKPEINLVVTRGGVPLADQAEGVRLFKEACLVSSKPLDIPEDVQETAYEEADAFSDWYGCDSDKRKRLTEAFERVIMAERERFMNEFEGAADGGIDAAIEAERNRCAEIVECWKDDLYVGEHIDNAVKRLAERIRSNQP